MKNDQVEHLFFLQRQIVRAVIFTAAELQLELDDATLTCLAPPLVLAPEADFSAADNDYKNQLCLFIDQAIRKVTETDRGLVLTFANGELLFEKKGACEILVVTDGNGEWHSYPQDAAAG